MRGLLAVLALGVAVVGGGCGQAADAHGPASQTASGSLAGYRFAAQPQVVASVIDGQPGGGYGVYFRLNRRLPLDRRDTGSYDKLSVLRDGVPDHRACYVQSAGFTVDSDDPQQTGQTVQVTIYALARGGRRRTGSLRMRGLVTHEDLPATQPAATRTALRQVGCGAATVEREGIALR